MHTLYLQRTEGTGSAVKLRHCPRNRERPSAPYSSLISGESAESGYLAGSQEPPFRTSSTSLRRGGMRRNHAENLLPKPGYTGSHPG
jgi:hypothetical protein